MKKIATIAAIAALATLSACTQTETVDVPVDENAAATAEASDNAVDRSELNVDKRKNPNEQIP